MKKTTLLIFFLLSFNALADNVLVLRGRVPASYRVELDQQKSQKPDHKNWKLVSNEKRTLGGPRLTVSFDKNHYLVSLTHP